MTSNVFSFGSLGAPLARSETQSVIDQLNDQSPSTTWTLTRLDSPLAENENKDEHFLGASAGEVSFIYEQIRSGAVRVSVLEASDLIQPLPEDLAVLCVPNRCNPFDALLNRQGLILDEMEPGSRIGVMSLRARSQMQALWPELSFSVLHGGVDRAMETHLRKSEIDGLVLPAAVTEHLGIQGIVAEIYSPDFLLPGPSQGVLVIVGRQDDDDARKRLSCIHSSATAVELKAEQAFYLRMVSDQDLPIGALARVQGQRVTLLGATGSGDSRLTASGSLEEAESVGLALAREVLLNVESFLDLLEADFPEGLPDEEGESEDDDDQLDNGLLDDDDTEKTPDTEDANNTLTEDDLDDLHTADFDELAFDDGRDKPSLLDAYPELDEDETYD